MLETLSYPFFQRALIVGVIMAITAALLGVFIVIRRMSFFTDAVAHASLTGVALALLVGVHPFFGALLVSVAVGFLVSRLARRGKQEVDTVIGVLFSSTLALGVVLISLMHGYRANLFQYLFGDIIAVTNTDVLVSVILFVAVSAVFAFTLKQLIQISLHEDMARVDRVPVDLVEALFLILLACVVAVGLKVVGSILMSALMILPAATAQHIARSFRGMVIASVVIAVVSMILGLLVSAQLSIASGPAVVLVATLFFALASVRGIVKSR